MRPCRENRQREAGVLHIAAETVDVGEFIDMRNARSSTTDAMCGNTSLTQRRTRRAAEMQTGFEHFEPGRIGY